MISTSLNKTLYSRKGKSSGSIKEARNGQRQYGREMVTSFDCRHFSGDRPCVHHKQEGARCGECGRYEPVGERILIIKLDAAGDVLRTTSILPSLKKKYPLSRITWITKPESVPFFFNNPLVDRAFDISQAPVVLGTDNFDLVINLDASPMSCRLASLSMGLKKLGYLYSEKGHVYPANERAMEWFRMGVDDTLKRRNRKTYQQIAHELCGLRYNGTGRLVLNLTEEERELAALFAREHRLEGAPLVIGFNTGAGGRWENKKWTMEGYMGLAELIENKLPDARILLYGGPEEAERNSLMRQANPDLVDTGCGNSIREFAALMGLCDILVTGDTLAMHIGVALGKKAVVLFGPTSHHEIELYGRGVKVVPPLPCVCCYRPSCQTRPTCMESISPETVLSAIESLLEVPIV